MGWQKPPLEKKCSKGGVKIKTYELIYIFDLTLGDDKIKEICDKFKTSIQQREGEVCSMDMWGKKRLSYPISKRKDGFYVYMNIKCLPSIINSIKSDFKLTEGLLKMSVIKVE